MDKNIKSVLELKRLVFDYISFKREGFSSDAEFQLKLKSVISKKKYEELYRVELSLEGQKEGEYKIEIRLFGFFAFDESESIDEKLKNELLAKNAIAILMPYLRSEVSILTAQPGVESVVLPPFNINKLMESN